MAFTRIEIAETAFPSRTLASIDPEQATRPSFRRVVMLMTIAAIHAMLLLLLIAKGGVGTHGHAYSGPGSGALTIFAVHQIKAKPAAAVVPETPRADTVSLARAKTLPLPSAHEWNTTELKVAVAPKTLASSSASASAVAATSGVAGSTAGNDGDYDPYAGSAPLRRIDGATNNAFALGQSVPLGGALGTIAVSAPKIDRSALERARLAAAAQDVRGHFTLVVQIDEGGIVKTVVAGWGPAMKDREALSAAFVGIRLFSNVPHGHRLVIATLPPIDIGSR